MADVAASTEVIVNLVWDPPWDASMMSDRAREHFGWR
jgi:metal-sulfur cluster biosynthetic enzyme